MYVSQLKDMGSQVALVVKNLFCQFRRCKTWVRSLRREDPLKEGMATCSLFLPGEPRGQSSLAVHGPPRVRHD